MPHHTASAALAAEVPADARAPAAGEASRGAGTAGARPSLLRAREGLGLATAGGMVTVVATWTRHDTWSFPATCHGNGRPVVLVYPRVYLLCIWRKGGYTCVSAYLVTVGCVFPI